VSIDPAELRRQLNELPLERQVALLSGEGFWTTEPIDELGIASVTLTDGPHGLRRQPDDADHLGIGDSVPATCFPTASNLAATWDRNVLEKVGAALGQECRADGVALLLGPGMNIKRHPGGGRNFEYLSEDPVLSGVLAAAMVRGIQSEGVGACLKHYVANNHESYRMVCDVIVDERTLRELYLRGFEIAVTESTPWAVMTSYNMVNGAYVGDSERLINGVLRHEWGFDGLVVTDWGGINDRVAAVRAGVDLEMPSSGGAHDRAVIDAVESGDLYPVDVLDRAMTVAELAMRATAEVERRGRGTIDEVAHHRLARAAAAAGTVLLSNDGVLPLPDDTDLGIIGAFADHPRYQGAGSSQVVPTRLDDARRHLEERFSGRVGYAAGYDPVTGRSDAARLRAATDLARSVDVPVVFVGLPAVDETEGCDRTSLTLPSAHDDLVSAVCAANPRTVVVLVNGAPVLLPWAEQPAAIVEAYLGGQAAGSAIVDVLAGDAEPGGRLAESFPGSMVFPAEENFTGLRRQVQYREGLYVGYRFHDSADVAPRFAFGHGLSYTTFEWTEIQVSGSGCDRTVEVTVTNTGERSGSDVVQLYVRDLESTVYRPDRELTAFAKVHLDAGESETVQLQLDERSFAYYDVDERRWRVESGEFELLIAASSCDVRDAVTIDVSGVVVERSPTGARGPGTSRFVATKSEFEAMLGHPIPPPTPVLPFTLNTVIEELDTTRLGAAAQAGFLRIADRQMKKLLGAEPDPVLTRLSERMIREAPLRFLVSMSGGSGSIKAFEGLTRLLSALRVTGRRR
jgi:beta-glucosidase